MTRKEVRKRRSEWFDDETIWRETYPFVFPEKRFTDAPEEIEKILALVSPVGKSVLDLCCGPGRCSVTLAKRGFSVTGVDRTKFLLDKARAFARAEHVQVEWVQRDMRDFVRPDSFDLALSTFTSFGYFEDRNDDVVVLRNVFASLRPGGFFFIETMGKEVLARLFQPSSANTIPDGSMLVDERKVIDGWSRIQNTWTVIRKGRAQQFTFRLNLYSGQELREQMERVGFVDVKLLGKASGTPYGPDADRLICVGRKA